MRARKELDREDNLCLRNRLRECVSGQKKSQISAMTGYSWNAVKGWLDGDRTIPAAFIMRVSQAYEVDPGWLLTGRRGRGATPEEALERELSEAYARMTELAGGLQRLALDHPESDLARQWLAVCRQHVAAYQETLDTYDRTAAPAGSSSPPAQTSAG